MRYHEGPYGWIKPDGTRIDCKWAEHETMLIELGVELSTAEQEGWARINDVGYVCLYQLTSEQKRTLRDFGLKVDRIKEMEAVPRNSTLPTDPYELQKQRMRAKFGGGL